MQYVHPTKSGFKRRPGRTLGDVRKPGRMGVLLGRTPAGQLLKPVATTWNRTPASKPTSWSVEHFWTSLGTKNQPCTQSTLNELSSVHFRGKGARPKCF